MSEQADGGRTIRHAVTRRRGLLLALRSQLPDRDTYSHNTLAHLLLRYTSA